MTGGPKAGRIMAITTVPGAHAIPWCMSVLLFAITLTTKLGHPVLVEASHPSPPSKLFLYVHADLISPERTFNSVLGYNGNATGFGAIQVFNWVLREGEAADSPVLGQLVGQSTTLRDGSFYLEFLYELDTPSFSGTIIAQGKQVAFQDAEAAITGGTGDFRFARGYTEIHTVSLDNLKDVVFSGSLHLKYD